MKQPKKLTRQNKMLLVRAGLHAEDWMKHFEDDFYLHIVSKDGLNKKIIDKERGEVIGGAEED